jgi:TonB family protein
MASLAVHIAVAFALLLISSVPRPHVARPLLSAPRLVSVVYIPMAPLDLPKLDLPELTAPVEITAPAPKPEPPPEVPVRPIETVAIEAPVARPVPVVADAPRTPPPVPAPPTPTVGLFPEATAAARAPEPARRVEAAGFDAPVKHTAESKLGQATVGAFDSAPQAGARQAGSATPANAVVTDSGFGRTAPASTSSPQTRTVRETGFGDSASREAPKAAEKIAEVKPAGFANALVTEAPRRQVAARGPTVTPVEVLSKPTPTYTEAARKLKIEGEVLLEVEFGATGSVTILRVVQGLGHGLDEAAETAAKQIRFKPAQDGGRPVDYRATVHIVFRLA